MWRGWLSCEEFQINFRLRNIFVLEIVFEMINSHNNYIENKGLMPACTLKGNDYKK